MSTCYGSPPVSFRETVEPLYLEYVDILLRRTAPDQKPDASQQDLVEARMAIESLKAAELREYFQDECVDAATVTGDQARHGLEDGCRGLPHRAP